MGLNLFGILGMFLAPPTLATLRVLWKYAGSKLQDKDPWEPEQNPDVGTEQPPFFGRLALGVREKIRGIKNNPEENLNDKKEKNEGIG